MKKYIGHYEWQLLYGHQCVVDKVDGLGEGKRSTSQIDAGILRGMGFADGFNNDNNQTSRVKMNGGIRL